MRYRFLFWKRPYWPWWIYGLVLNVWIGIYGIPIGNFICVYEILWRIWRFKRCCYSWEVARYLEDHKAWDCRIRTGYLIELRKSNVRVVCVIIWALYLYRLSWTFRHGVVSPKELLHYIGFGRRGKSGASIRKFGTASAKKSHSGKLVLFLFPAALLSLLISIPEDDQDKHFCSRCSREKELWNQ